MKKLPNLVSVLSLTAVIVLGTVGGAQAAPSATKASGQTPPASGLVSGPQDKPAIEPGSRDATLTEPLGPTSLAKTDASGKLQAAQGVSALAGNVANVDFLAPLNYCARNLAYTPIKNATAVAKSVQIRVYNQTGYRDIYTSVAANSTAYPAFYGISGAYTAYLYVWNGTSYQYDELRTSTHTCSVSVTRVYNSAGWVQLKIQNTGTAYASQKTSELAPFPASGTYTGTHYDYPAAGGAAIYRWFSVGTSPYGIVSHTLGSVNTPYIFTGDL